MVARLQGRPTRSTPHEFLGVAAICHCSSARCDELLGPYAARPLQGRPNQPNSALTISCPSAACWNSLTDGVRQVLTLCQSKKPGYYWRIGIRDF
ncbi:hypothetical protein LY76DRAFT_48486 [Colletotrichum caudatum]|nr:hypothetical protein LY76DRAFT_48486 [Colletotrichum caudatum]